MAGTAARHFCPNCGAPREPHAHFCELCGHHFADAGEAPTQPLAVQEDEEPRAQAPPAPGGVAAPPRRRLPWVAIAIGAAILLAAVAAVLVLVLGGGNGKDKDYEDQIAGLIAPVGTANDDLSSELEGLGSGSRARAALLAVRDGSTATRDAQTGVARRSVPDGERDLREAVDAALASQARYLAAVTKALGLPSSETAAAVEPRALDARDRWDSVAQTLAGAGGTISGFGTLARWARSASHGGGGTSGGGGSSADVSFAGNVESILSFSKPAYDRVNTVATGMKAGTIAFDDARNGLNFAIANRQTAYARASALVTSSAAAANVKQLLMTALQRSEANDRDFYAALDFYATEEVDAFDSAMATAAASSGPASAAKKSFLDAYNSLRRSAGLGPTGFSTF